MYRANRSGWRRVPNALQDRLRESRTEDCYRSRWAKPRFEISATTRYQKRQFLEETGVASVSIHKRDDISRTARGVHGGFVYNLEVEGLHTYTANGVVVHNCHHLLHDNLWGRAVRMFPNARGLGVTATPLRADGKGLGRHADGVLDTLIIGPTMRDLITEGYLTDYRIFAPSGDFDRSTLSKGSTGDFTRNSMSKAVQESKIVGDVVDHYRRIAPGKLGITFTPDVESATLTAERFRDAGVPAEVVSAKTPDLERSRILRRFRDRELLQLVNVDLFGEGFDLPAIEVVSMARPTESYGLYAQQFGRALRPLDGKEHAIIIDHVGNVIRHGLPDSPREWTLDRRETRGQSKQNADVIPVKACPQCAGVYERIYAACPYCGFKPKPSARSGPEQVDGDLLELDAGTLARLRGEAVDVDLTPAEFLAKSGAAHLPRPAAAGAAARFREKQEAQRALREEIAVWAGWQRANGRPDSESYRRFYLQYGIDVLSAQALGRKEAEALLERISVDR